MEDSGRERKKQREREGRETAALTPALSLRPSLQSIPKRQHQEAKSKFQALQRIYAVLSDDGKRASYDRTGSLDAAEGLSGESFDELYAYFRDKFKEVTPADLDDYELRFRGGPEEERELFELYGRFRGSMEKVFEWLVCSDPSRDAHRFAAAVRRGIASGELESFPAFERWCRAKVDGKAPPAEVREREKNLSFLRERERGFGVGEKRNEERKTRVFFFFFSKCSTKTITKTKQDPLKPRPRAAEMEAAAGKKGNGVSSLALQIRANNGEDRLAGIIASIEARASGGGAGGRKKTGAAAASKKEAPKKSKKQKAAPPPTDEEFEAAAARLAARRRANNKKAA